MGAKKQARQFDKPDASLDRLTAAVTATETALAGLREAITAFAAQKPVGDDDDDSLIAAALEARKERGVPLPGGVVKQIIFEGDHPVRAVREWRNYTQAGLAEAAETSEAYIRHIENRRASPGVKTLKKLGRAMNVDWTVLVDDGRPPVNVGQP